MSPNCASQQLAKLAGRGLRPWDGMCSLCQNSWRDLRKTKDSKGWLISCGPYIPWANFKEHEVSQFDNAPPPVEGPNFRHTDPVSSLNKQEVDKSATVTRDHPLRPVEWRMSRIPSTETWERAISLLVVYFVNSTSPHQKGML